MRRNFGNVSAFRITRPESHHSVGCTLLRTIRAGSVLKSNPLPPLINQLSGAAEVWPLAARAQRPAMPVVGFLSTSSQRFDDALRLAPFREGLKEIRLRRGRDSLSSLPVNTRLDVP